MDPSPDRVGGRAGAYATAWVAGLAVWPSNLDVTSSDTKVMSAYTGHRGVAMAQYLLVEGVAAIALAVVAIALGRAALLAASLIVSGAGYLLLDNGLAQAAAVSLPLLLIWVAATGLSLGHARR